MTQKIIIAGDPVNGFQFFGPVPEELHPSQYRFVRSLEDGGEETWPALLEALPTHGKLGTAEVSAAAGKAGPSVYFTMHSSTGPSSSFGIIDRELVEAYDRTESGAPDWVNGAVCDEARGDAAFFFPALALLRYWASSAEDLPGWHHSDLRWIAARLDQFIAAGAVAGYRPDVHSGGYIVTGKCGSEQVLRSPDEARAYFAGLRSAAA